MKNVQALLFTLLCILPLQSHAEGECNGFFLITPDEEVCIMMTCRPHIEFFAENKIARLNYVTTTDWRNRKFVWYTVDADNPLKIVYGTYVPTSIDGVQQDKVVITEQGNRKYISGGKLIIVKGNKMYNSDGTLIE